MTTVNRLLGIEIILKRSIYVLSVILFFIGVMIFIRQQKPITLKTEFYVWQRAWTSEVQKGIVRAVEYADGFMVLAGEVDVQKEQLEFRVVPVKWAVLSKNPVPVTVVVRMRTSLHLVLKNDGIEEAVTFLIKHINEIVHAAQAQGVHIAGIQLDYDCPTSRLKDYRTLLKRLIASSSESVWSITTLPTWLSKTEFKKLVAQLSYFVLQVYSFEVPEQLGDDVSIVHTERIPGYIRQAVAVETPFYIALPSYGYAAIFDEQGRFVGLEAETRAQQWPPTYTKKEVMAQPDEIAPVVTQLVAQPPERMLGIVWFRLPVDGDKYNWSWLTLLAVMDGKLPVINTYQVEVRQASDALYEVWVTNHEHSEYHGRIQMTIQQTEECGVIAEDLLRGFSEKVAERDNVHILTGKVPSPGKQAMVSWYRVACKSVRDNQLFQVSEVKSLQ